MHSCIYYFQQILSCAISGFEEIEVSKHIPLPFHKSLPSRICGEIHIKPVSTQIYCHKQ